MKTRNGFVSNSSSTSYLIGFKEENLLSDTGELLEYLEKSDGSDVFVIGKKLSSGRDLFVPEGKIREWLLDHKDELICDHPYDLIGIISPVTAWNEYCHYDSPIGEKFSEITSRKLDETLEAGMIVLNLEIDDHYTSQENADDVLERRYGG